MIIWGPNVHCNWDPTKKKLPINGFRPHLNSRAGSDGSRVVGVGGLARCRWLDSGWGASRSLLVAPFGDSFECLSVYMSLLSVYRALLSVYKPFGVADGGCATLAVSFECI